MFALFRFLGFFIAVNASPGDAAAQLADMGTLFSDVVEKGGIKLK
jgi:hypothetical protein